MKCDFPLSVKLKKPIPDKSGGWIYTIPVGCGKCYNCKKNKISAWAFRLDQQSKIATRSNFVTLTYDTHNVPLSKNGFMDFSKAHVQDFFKKLRYIADRDRDLLVNSDIQMENAVKCEGKISYYLSAEFGELHERPHYHAIIFNAKPEWIREAWDKGAVHIADEFNIKEIFYTLKYIEKKEFNKRHGRDDRMKEFSMMSKGIGDNYVTSEVRKFHVKDFDNNNLVLPNGQRIPMPAYYRKLIYGATSSGDHFRDYGVETSANTRSALVAYVKDKVEQKEKEEREAHERVGIDYEQKRIDGIRSRKEKMENYKKRYN